MFFNHSIRRQEDVKLLNELHVQDIEICGECCIDTFNSIIFCNSEKVCTETFNNKSNWKLARKYRITASRAYSAYTYGKDDWDTKIKNCLFPKEFSSIYTDRGIKWESIARQVYCRLNNACVQQTGLIVRQSDTWISVSPDGIILEDGVPTKLLEIQCSFIGNFITASEIPIYCSYLIEQDEKLTLKEKHMYSAQVQISMAVLGVEQCDFVIFSSFDSSILTTNVHFNYIYTKKILYKLKEIFFKKFLHYICTIK